MRVKFPVNYPFAAPEIVFKSKIYHPSVAANGKVCLEILTKGWTVATKITHSMS